MAAYTRLTFLITELLCVVQYACHSLALSSYAVSSCYAQSVAACRLSWQCYHVYEPLGIGVSGRPIRHILGIGIICLISVTN